VAVAATVGDGAAGAVTAGAAGAVAWTGLCGAGCGTAGAGAGWAVVVVLDEVSSSSSFEPKPLRLMFFSVIGVFDRPGATMVTQFSEAQFLGAWIWILCPWISKEIAWPACATAVEARKSAVAATESLVMAASQCGVERYGPMSVIG
jgi:hypothetical protein